MLNVMKSVQIDLYLAMTLFWMIIAIVALCMIAPKAKNKDADVKIEGLLRVVMTYDDMSDDDIDLHIKAPNGQEVYFNAKVAAGMFLDLDDVGFASDTMQGLDGKPIIIRKNEEIVTMRGLMNGEYIVFCHAWRLNSPQSKVKCEIFDIKTKRYVYSKSVDLHLVRQYKTFIRFVVEDGKIVSTNNLDYQPDGVLN